MHAIKQKQAICSPSHRERNRLFLICLFAEADNAKRAGSAVRRNDASGLHPRQILTALLMQMRFNLAHDVFAQTRAVNQPERISRFCAAGNSRVICMTTRFMVPRYFLVEISLPSRISISG